MDKTKLKGVAALIAAAVAVILAAFLCMSFPMAEVHAATTYGVSSEQDLVYRMAYAKEGDTIQLNASLTMDLTDADFVRETFGSKAEPNKDVYLDATTELPAQSQTLDLNGHTLTIITGYTRCFSLTGDVTLTITDSSAERTGAIVGYSNGSLFYSGTAESSLVLQDVAVKFTEHTEGGASITPTGAVIDTVGDVTLNNVTYTPAEGGPALIEDNAGAQVPYIADTPEKLAAAVAGSSYSTVMLGADITQNITVEAGRTLTLDLNGHTLSSEIGGVATIWNKGSLAIKSSAEGGTITREVSGMYYVIRNNGVMTIDGTNLTVYNDNASDGSSLIDNNILSTTDLEDESIVDRQAKLTITGGTYRSANSNAVKNDPNGTLIIESGSFTSNTAGNGAVFTYDDTTIIDGTFVNTTTEPTGLNTGYAVYATVEDGLTNTLQINGGTFTAEKAIYLQNGGGVNSVTISNGTFNGIVDADNFMYPVSAADTFAVSGGTFNGAFSIGHTMQVSLTGGDYANVPSSDYLAEDVNIYQYTAGDKEGQFVLAYEQPADTTEIGYVMIGSVFYNTLREALAASGSSIYLCRDITESVTYSGTSSKYIYLSGYTWTAEEGSPALTTESGSGRVTLYGGSGGDGLMQRTDEGAVVVNAGSVRFMTSGSHSVAVTGAASGSYALIENSGTLEIRAGRFVCSENGTILQNDGGTVTVLGGTFSSVFDELDSSNSYTYITDGYYLADNGDGTYTVSRVVAWVDLDHNGIMGDGEVFFTSVQDAVAVAQSGDTVVMLYNSSTDVVVAEGQDITLELRSGTLSASITNNGTLTITGTDGRVENGVTNNGTLSIQGGTFKSGRETSDATTNIYLEEVYAHLADGYYFVSCSGNYYFTVGEGERVATIEDGDFTLDVGSVAVAINYVTNVAKSANVTVTLLQDDSLQASTTIGSVSQSYATNVTFDLGGNTLSTGYLLSVYSSDKTSSFYVTITNGVLALSYADDSTARVAISATYQANLTLSDLSVVYSGGHSYDNLINAGNSYGSASSVSTINFVNANVSVADGAAVPTNMVMVYNSSTATFDGGNYFGAISAAEGASITIAEGSTFGADVEEFLAKGLTQNDAGTVVNANYETAVAMIETADGIVYYDTLQAAINAAKNGDTVTLLDDIIYTAENAYEDAVGVYINKSIILDGNNFKISSSTVQRIIRIYNDNSNTSGIDVTIKNLEVEASGSSDRCVETRNAYIRLTLDNVVLDGRQFALSHPYHSQPLTIGGDTSSVQENVPLISVTVKNSTILTDEAGYAIITFNPVDLTIENSTINEEGLGWAAVYLHAPNGSYGADHSTVKVSGSTIYSTNQYTTGDNSFGAFVFEADYVTLTIGNSKLFVASQIVEPGEAEMVGQGLICFSHSRTDDGTIIHAWTDNNVQLNENEITITGTYATLVRGYEDGYNNAAKVAGGSINIPVGVRCIADGYMLAVSTNGQGDPVYAVLTEEEIATDYVATVAAEDNTVIAYTSLQDAINAAESGATVTLLKDTKLEGDRIEIGSASEESAAAFEITFDLNGYTLKIGLVAADISAEEPNYNTAALFVGYNATLNLIDSSKEGTGTIDAQEASDLTVPVAAMRAGAALNISGGTIIVDTAYESCVYAGGGGVVVINGGTFINRCAEPFIHVSDGSSPALAVNISDSYTDGGTYLTINGGTFVGRNPMLGDTNPAVTSSYMGSDVNIAQFSDGSFAAVGADEPLPEGAAYLYTVENGEVVVTVYTEEALSAAVAGDETFADNTYATVRLGTDITQSIVIEDGRDLTLDLNGKTITTYTERISTVTVQGATNGQPIEVTITDTKGNGAIVDASDTISGTPISSAVAVYEAANVTFKNVSLQSKTYYALYMGGKVKAPSVQVSGSTFTGGWAGAAITGINDSEQPVKFIAEDSTFTGGWYGVSGHGESHYTYIELTNCTVTGTLGDTTSTNYKDLSLGLYHPQNGTLIIDGGKITGVASGIEMRAGSLTVKGDAVITATAENAAVGPNGSGNTVIGAAVAVSQHTTNLAIGIDLQSGTYNGVYALREADVADPGKGEPVTMSVSGGIYNGEIGSENVKNFITGGSFAVRPADKYFGEDFTAQYEGGYYVPVYSTALKEARIAAQTDVRAYAATLGFAWADIEAAAAEGSEEAKLVLKTYNAIAEAASTLAVAEAKEDAFAAVEAYDEAVAKAEADAAAAFESYKAEQLKELKALAADDVNTADVDESVVLPTATWFALNNAETQEEFDEYLANAKAEIEAIRSLRTEISGQTQQLADLADALTAMSEGLFGDTESGTQGAFAELLGDVQGAIKQAQNAIVNGTTGEDGATTSTSLASIQNYLAEKIKTTLDSINTALNDTTNGLKAIKDAITDLDVSDQLEDGFGNVLTAITNAQNAIMGATGENAGKSIADAISEINETTASAVKGLRNELVGEDGKGGMLGTIVGYVDGLKDMLGDKDSGLAAIVANIKAAQAAIMGVTEEDADGVSLSEVLSAVGDVNSAVTDALATMNQTLAAWQQTVADYAETLAGIETALGDGAGSLYDRIDSAITAAQDAIMGSTGGEGGTSIGAAVSDLKTELSAVQKAIIDAMPNYSDQLTTISRNIEALQTLLNGNNGLAAIKKELDGVVSAIGSATSGDTSASGLFALLEAIQSGNSTIASAVTAVQNALLGTNNNGALADITAALDTAQDDLDSLTGALLEANGGLATDITDALAAIDQIAAAIGSLGTGEGNDLATQIGGIVSDIEAVQGAVDEIGSNLGVAVDIEETKTNAVADLEVWLNAYLDTLLGTTTDEAESGVVMLAVTLETEDGDLYGRLTQAYSEANAQLILKYYNQALTAIDNATSTTDVSTAVSTFRVQVLLYDDLAAAQNTPSMTGVYVLLAIVLVVLIAASIVVILKNRKAAAVAAEPAAEAAAEEKPAEEAKPEAAEEAAEEGSEMEESAEAEKPEAEEELAADDDDKEQVVIAANVRSFAEAYVELSDEQRELFNKVKEYALGKEGTSEVKLSSGVCVKLGSKQVVKLAVRRGNPVALFVLENEMLKDFRRGATTQAKLKVRATELVLREEADLETAYTMVDLSIDQIKKDAEAAKERRREQRRERRKQRLAEEAARQAEHDGSED